MPQVILDKVGPTRLHADVLCVNGNTFLHVKSDYINIRTTSDLTSRSKTSILEGLLKVVSMHRRRGFEVTHRDTDMDFECIENDID